MALTYLATSMIERPTVFSALSVTSLNLNTITSSPSVLGNLTIYGSLTALSGFNVVIASTTSTSALSVSNIQMSPALQVFQGPAGQVIALFRNQAGDAVTVRDTGILVNGILSATNAGSSNLWHSVYTTTLANSANWSNVYTNVQSNSSVFTNVQSNSSVFTNVQSNSANWQSTYTTVCTNSSQWASNIDVGIRSLSSNWQSTYLTVNTLSTSWEESADILPTVTNYLSTSNVLVSSVTLNGSFVGATSATTIDIGALSARTFDLIHSPANDGVDPIFNIGETSTDGFSGIRVRYEETSNRLFISSRTGSTILTSAIINTVTGQVGISGNPAPGQTLTINGNMSASGNIVAGNNILGANTPLYYYLDNNRTEISGSVVPPLSFTTYFEPTAALNLQSNKIYELEYNLFYSRNSTSPISFALSSTPPLNHISIIGIQSPATGFGNTGNAAATLLGTGLVSAQPVAFIPILSTGTLVANVSYFTRFITQIQTSATSIPFTTLAVMVCAGSWPGNTNSIVPLKGSYRKITLIS